MKHKNAVLVAAAINTVGVFTTQQIARFAFWVLGGNNITPEERDELQEWAQSHIGRAA